MPKRANAVPLPAAAGPRFRRKGAAVALESLPEGWSAPAVNAGNTVRIRAVPAVRRATAILWHLARNGDGLGVSRISRDLGIIPSTCLHILRELVVARLVAFEPNGKLYRLGLGVLGLAKEVSRRDPFIQAAQPQLNSFVRDFNVSASATQRDGEDMVVVATATASEGDVLIVGNRVPCLSSASGRLIAAHSGWSESQLKARFERVRWQHPPDFQKWLREVKLTRTRRHAIDDGQFRRGITSIAAAVFSREGTVSRTISINVVSAQLDSARRATFVDAVERTGSEIAQALA